MGIFFNTSKLCVVDQVDVGNLFFFFFWGTSLLNSLQLLHTITLLEYSWSPQHQVGHPGKMRIWALILAHAHEMDIELDKRGSSDTECMPGSWSWTWDI